MKSTQPSALVELLKRSSLRPTSRPGPEVISLASGDPDFDTPIKIRRALYSAIEAGVTHYGQQRGDPELRRWLAEDISAAAARRYDESNVVITHGANAGLAAVFLATVNAADRVLIPEPTYSLYADQVHIAGGTPVEVPAERDMHLDLAALEDAAAGARMVVLCHPCNPTGVVYRPEELAGVAEIARRHDLLVLVDEAYNSIVFDGVRFVSSIAVEALQERLVHVQTFSKKYAMTGWRLGYVVCGDVELADAIGRVHYALNGTVNSAVQRAALAAREVPASWLETARTEYQDRWQLAANILSGTPGVTITRGGGTFYLFLRYSASAPSVQVTKLAQHGGVAVRAGREFGPGGEGHLRISCAASPERLREGIARLRGVLTGLATREPAAVTT